MIWLAGQIWPFLLLAALLGAGLVLALSTRKVTVERWVFVREAQPETTSDDEQDEPEQQEKAEKKPAAQEEAPASPFPVAAAVGEPAPWEQEELWSRPAKVVSSGTSRGPKDEWADAAQNWRSWADEATGKDQDAPEDEGRDSEDDGWRPAQPSEADRDLFAADREAETSNDPFPHAKPVEATFRYDEPVDTPLPRSDTPFPFAQPVDATPLPPTDPFPPFGGPPGTGASTPQAATPEPEPIPEPEPTPEPEPIPEPEPEPEPARAVHMTTLDSGGLGRHRGAPSQDDEPEPAPDFASGGLGRPHQHVTHEEPEPEPAPEPTSEAEPEPEPEPEPDPEPAATGLPPVVGGPFSDDEDPDDWFSRIRPVDEPATSPFPLFADADADDADDTDEVADDEDMTDEPRADPAPTSVASALDSLDDWVHAQPASAPDPVEATGRRATPESPYGPGSAFAPYDGSMPPGFPVKGHAPSMLYHPPRGRFYTRTIADVWFDSDASAEAAGFTRWDRRGTQSFDVGRASRSDDA